MSERHRPPHRRLAISSTVEHAGFRFRLQTGYFENGTLGEIFIDAEKQNTAVDAVASDAAILISLLLQRGSCPAEIGHALRRDPRGAPASLIGAAVDALKQIGGQ